MEAGEDELKAIAGHVPPPLDLLLGPLSVGLVDDKGEDLLLEHLQEVVDVVDGILHPVDTATLENYKILEVMPDRMISDGKKGSEMPDRQNSAA